MSTNNIGLKSISELLGMNFFIPSYQRGYRWEEQQIVDLLNDIDSFTPKEVPNSIEKTWYCLQPLVVKQKGDKWEVIDGQQRLTTIFLIIHYFNEMWIGKQKISEPDIAYETRRDSFEFLKGIKVEDNDTVKTDNTNIDYYHISSAYATIHNWVKEKGEFDNNNFQSKFKEHTKVIWYETDQSQDGRDIFTRINMGKIPLTNAELIKALFLNSSNFPNSESEVIRLRQLELASEWDRIEYSLRNEELWYFINNSDNELPTRIEHIFNIMKNIESVQNGNDQYSTFRFFSEKFKTNTKDEIDNNWKEIKRIFQNIEEWFSDRELYHKVGFLITYGEKITDLLIDVKSSQKNDFKKLLDSKISGKIKCDNLEGLEYGDGSIKNILLLHNIQTMLSNKNETSRFPFDRYKKEKWDIEHIHATASEAKVKDDIDEQKKWLSENFEKNEEVHTDEELNKRIENFNNRTEKDDNFQEIIEYILGEEDNSLRNLCLLDRGTNRSYKNDSFKNKRKKIIEQEKLGTFIPICTRNVFMKYYSEELTQLGQWSDNDRDAYFNDIKNVLQRYLSDENKES